MQAGKGYQYWSRFETKASEISKLSAEIYQLLFGQIVEIGTQSPDVPRAGQPYSAEAFKMILDMVNIFNQITPVMWQESRRKKGSKAAANTPELEDDPDGSMTVAFLERIKDVGRFAFDPSLSGSLGFDPAVYCYGPEKFYTAAYLAALKFAVELKAQDKLLAFTEARKDFEEFLVSHKSFIKDISHGKGSRTRPLESLLTLHRTVLDCISGGVRTDEDIVAKLIEHSSLKTALKVPDPTSLEPETPPKKKRKTKNFPKSVQQAAVLQATLNNRERCTECGARLAPFSRSKDHVIEKERGGDSVIENLHFTHPYCNSGYKTRKRHQAEKEVAANKTL